MSTGITRDSASSMPATGEMVDLHELAKGWKAAIARAKDPATRYVPRKAHSVFIDAQVYSSC